MTRIEKIRDLLKKQNIDAFYITHLPNIRYVSGFSGSSAFVIITPGKNFFITDFRYQSQSAEEVKGFEISISNSSAEAVKKIIAEEGLHRIAFESSHLTCMQLDKLNAENTGVEFIPVAEELEKMNMIKTQDELGRIKKAAEITDKVFDKILGIIKPGMKEKDVSAEISYWHKKFGAEMDSFDAIVASGWRGSLPHGRASDKIIESGEMVTLDFGCIYEGFCSDLTRTIAVGKPSDEMKKIYSVVLEAQLKAIAFAKAGVTTKELDNEARQYINSKGYEGKFGHGLGHGLGIEVHEMPSVSQKMDMKLPEGVVVTIEPGIYVENLGGVRIEDDVIISAGGCEVINKSSKELIIL
jgi:Xaa-Pro aminopeptidase